MVDALGAATPDTTRGDSATFFSLGVFSGIASSCCAPCWRRDDVIGTVGQPVLGLVLGLAFVFGMVIPLLLMALLWDGGARQTPLGRAKPLRFTVAATTCTPTASTCWSAWRSWSWASVITLAGSPTMTVRERGSSRQPVTGSPGSPGHPGLARPVPDAILGVGLLALAGVFEWATLRDRRRPIASGHPDDAANADAAAHCHSESAADQPIADHHETSRN